MRRSDANDTPNMWVTLNDGLRAAKLPQMEKRAVANDNGNAQVPEADGEALIAAGMAEPHEPNDEEQTDESDADADENGDTFEVDNE